ncbi:hypothetical protein BDY19DRAFT_575540 [Irpex rosettiformis]|uniref:Uncharacterized protein n=1 Tax=Irpex rosettiformis TaxID=378272 RepID=A0ACB8UCR1_9APHY|nr:hypothetical protein BDY19DRAFT_575540 [Irpex rosettiformis]
MRRLVAALTGKRSDKSDIASNASSADHTSSADPRKAASPKRSGFFKTKSLSRASAAQQDSTHRNVSKPPVLTTAEHAPSSASSSSGGPSTPRDDVESVGHPHSGMKPWAPLTYLHDKVLPPIAAQDPSRPYIPLIFSQDDDTLSVHSDEISSSLQLPPNARAPAPSQPIMPSAYCRAIASNALVSPFSPPPLLVVPSAPLYPRSCNSPRQLSRPTESLHYQLCQARILRRLDSTPADRYLAPFANRKALPPRPLSLDPDDIAIPKGSRVVSSSLGLRRWIERPCFEDRVLVYLPAENQTGVFRCERVSAMAAVEALGYSEALDALAGMPDEDVAIVNQDLFATSPASLTPPLSLTPSTASFSSLPPSPAAFTVTETASSSPQGAKTPPAAPYKPSPSPLRKDYTTEAGTDWKYRSPAVRSVSSPAITPLPTRPSELTSSVSSPNTATSPAMEIPKVGVRFADDEKDENVPLDYVMRIKQARDQKAKFLAAERARRQSVQGPLRPSSVRPSLDNPQQMREDLKRVAEERRRLEEEKKRYETERRRQEEERMLYEKERAAWEREKKHAEEERKHRAYADEVADARRRRESSRQGSVTKIENMGSWTGDREKERERKESQFRPQYSRAKYDDASIVSRREVSDASYGGSSTNLRLHIPPNSSPGSSRPPSIATGSVRDSSRPPSMYSTPPSSASAIDVRQRRESKASRRTSFMSDGSALGAQQMFMQSGMPSTYPWGVPPVPAIPAVMNMNMMPGVMPMPMPMMQMQMPMMPYSDMPLLPPSAPFMQQGGPRQQRSHSASPTRSTPGSDRGHSAAGWSSPHGSHHRMPSDELPKRQQMNRSSSYATSPPSSLPKQSPSTTSLQSGRLQSPSSASYRQSHTPPVRPTPVQSRSQPAFQNLSRPPSDRRQTVIR